MSYVIDGKEYSFDSSTNQRILDRLVQREVFTCMTGEVEFILEHGWEHSDAPFTREDVVNYETKVCDNCGCQYFDEFYPDDKEVYIDSYHYDIDEDDPEVEYYCPVCGITWETEEEARSCCDKEQVYVCESCKKVYNENEYDDMSTRDNEVYEWWAVTDWFGEKLEELGEAVIKSWNTYWGRTTSGQSIAMDYVIAKIAYDMGILEGQHYSWEER